MKAIWKYPVPVADSFSHIMPVGAKVLTIQLQRNEPQMWVLIDLNSPATEARNFQVYGTGHPIRAENIHYLGTFQVYSGDLVFHVFEEVQP